MNKGATSEVIGSDVSAEPTDQFGRAGGKQRFPEQRLQVQTRPITPAVADDYIRFACFKIKRAMFKKQLHPHIGRPLQKPS